MSLGTIITEWDQGKRICSELLEDDGKMDEATSRLAAIQQFFGFDGWLVNIENTLEPHEVDMMIRFVGMLRFKCIQVIWFVCAVPCLLLRF